MKKIAILLVACALLSECSMTSGVKDNPFVGSWTWNGGTWSFTSALTFTGPSSSGGYSYSITTAAPYNGNGTVGVITIAGQPQTYNFTIADSQHIGLSHSVSNPNPPPSTMVVSDGVLLAQ